MRYLMLMGFAGLLFGQGTETKRKPEEYDVHAQALHAAIGAEFMVHSFSRGEQMFITENYLVVDVAVFPNKGEILTIQNGNFQLRINGKKQPVQPQPATMVAADLQHPEWRGSNGVSPEVSGSVGNVGVMMGGPPRNTNRFPGGETPGSQPPPRVPVPQDNPGGIHRETVKPEEVVLQTALVEGQHGVATSGFLYFPYKGKISSIKSLELLYEDAVMKLR